MFTHKQLWNASALNVILPHRGRCGLGQQRRERVAPMTAECLSVDRGDQTDTSTSRCLQQQPMVSASYPLRLSSVYVTIRINSVSCGMHSQSSPGSCPAIDLFWSFTADIQLLYWTNCLEASLLWCRLNSIRSFVGDYASLTTSERAWRPWNSMMTAPRTSASSTLQQLHCGGAVHSATEPGRQPGWPAQCIQTASSV